MTLTETTSAAADETTLVLTLTGLASSLWLELCAVPMTSNAALTEMSCSNSRTPLSRGDTQSATVEHLAHDIVTELARLG